MKTGKNLCGKFLIIIKYFFNLILFNLILIIYSGYLFTLMYTKTVPENIIIKNIDSKVELISLWGFFPAYPHEEHSK